MVPGIAACHADGDYDDPRWDPFWRAAVELGLPLSFHILTSNEGLGGVGYRGPKMNSFLGIIRGCQDIIGTLIFGGVFERVPELRGRVRRGRRRAGRRTGCTAPTTRWTGTATGSATATLSRLPSEYFRENVYADVPGRLGRVPRRRT